MNNTKIRLEKRVMTLADAQIEWNILRKAISCKKCLSQFLDNLEITDVNKS